MKNLYRIAAPAYLLALVLILFSVVDVAIGIWPMQFGEVSWRFATEGLLSRSLVTPLLGLLLLFSAAVLLEQPRVLKSLSIAEGLAALVLALGVVVFLLDAAQMRAQVAQDAMSRFYLGTLVALMKFGVGFIVLLIFSALGWRAGSSMTKATKNAKADPKSSIVQPGGRPGGTQGGPTIAK